MRVPLHRPAPTHRPLPTRLCAPTISRAGSPPVPSSGERAKAEAGASAAARRTAALLTLLVATAIGAGIPARADETGGQEALTLDEVERRIEEAGARLETLDAEIAAGRERRRELEVRVAESESRLGERRERITGLDADIARFETRLAELEAAIARERASVDTRRERLAATLRGTRRVEQAGGLRSLLEHDDPALAARLDVYAEYLLRAQRRTLDEQVRALASIEAAHETTLRDRAWLEHIKRKASGQRDAFADVRRERGKRLDALDEDLASKVRSVAELSADRERLQTLMEELRALQSTRSGYFAAGRGEHPWPVDGTVKARFGEAKAVGKVHWNGVFVAAAAGKPVRAVADGEIVYADRLQGFGRLVIIDHGDGFMTLYGGNREIRGVPGDWVDSGATIATVGDGSGQSESGVYFEIRENARPIDPAPWLGPEGADG